MQYNHLKRTTFRRANAPVSAGATVVNGTAIQASGCQSIVFSVDFGAIGTIAGTPSMYVESSPDNSTWTPLATPAPIPLTTAFANKIAAIEVATPRTLWYRVTIDRGGTTNSIVINSAHVQLVGDRKQPVTPHSDLQANSVGIEGY